MKKLILVIATLCVTLNVSATRCYHPHKKKIEVTFTDGDRVVFSTQYTTVSVTSLKIVSRNNITYTIPEDELQEIVRPQIDTVHLVFQRMGEKYQEGTFTLLFDYKKDDSTQVPAMFLFKNGVFQGTELK